MMFAAQSHQVFNAVSVFAATHTTCLNVMYIVCNRTTHLTWDKIALRVAEMLKIYLCVLLQRCKVCGIIAINFKNVDKYLIKHLHRYKKVYYICRHEHSISTRPQGSSRI